MRWIERISVGLASGMVAGFAVLGIGGRIAMRLISIAEGKQGTFTVRGTFGVLLAFSIIGTILSIPFSTLQRFLPSSNSRRGVTFGLFLMVVIVWVPSLLIGLDADGLNLSSIVGKTIFSALFLGYGLTLAFVTEWLTLDI